jgi:succinate-semialdehyde dehydrogenase / glutarate-semialdehyde dehydrogenase
MTLFSSQLFQTKAYINGAWCDGHDGKTFSVTNPETGELLAKVADCAPQDVHKAIAAAQSAFPIWRDKTAKERSKTLRNWYDLIIAHADELADILAKEQGKPLFEAKAEILYGASFVEWFAEEAKRVYGETIPASIAGRELFAFKEPIGVTAAITPWNFPSAMITRKVAPALAVGCTSIIKPAPETPLSALALAVLAHEAGIPAGVLNVLPTNRAQEVGQVLTTHPVIRKVSFTGSTEVGRIIMRQSADTIKKLSLELGGNAPFIVFDDADLDAAVIGAMASKYRNSGQTCVCPNRFYVQAGVYEAFAQKLKIAVSNLKLGGAFEPDVSQGPLINNEGLEKVVALVADAVSKGATALIGGKKHALGGTFYEPTILINVSNDSRLLREEIFGPVAPLIKFETEEEAIELANASEFGLAAYFYARDVGRIFRVARKIESGMIGVNEGVIGAAEAPFGGVKQSGLGREGSRHGVDDYLEIKYMCFGGLIELRE